MCPDGSFSTKLGLALPHNSKPVSNHLCVLPGHFQPAYLGASSSSKAALAYIHWLQQVVSDGNQSPDYATVRPSHALDEVVSSSGVQLLADVRAMSRCRARARLPAHRMHASARLVTCQGTSMAWTHRGADRTLALAAWREQGDEAANGFQPVVVVRAGLPGLVRQPAPA